MSLIIDSSIKKFIDMKNEEENDENEENSESGENEENRENEESLLDIDDSFIYKENK